jgi:hypothetical protein
MIVPQFWAEARLRDRIAGRQVTVRRWGWSDQSQEAAQRHAEGRAREALDRIRAGEHLSRRERKVAYNAAGLPIREEVLERHGETVVTRNSYGARCLNTPNVLFADIDFPPRQHWSVLLFLLVLLVPAGLLAFSWKAAFASFVLMFLAVSSVFAWFDRQARQTGNLYEASERAALARVERFVERRPEWEVRVYRTPAGLRVLATHRTLDPHEPEVEECFRELAVDPLYARMCRNQKCFRARVSPKPWRVGVHDSLRPRGAGGVWPVAPELLPQRAEWLAAYEAASEGFASCRYLTTFGTGGTHPAARAVADLHDRLSRATSELPLA